MNSFDKGFLKRAQEWRFPMTEAHEMLNVIHEKMEYAGFTDNQLSKNANLVGAIDHIKDTLLPTTKSSLTGIADDLEPSIQGSNNKSLMEALAIGGHMAGNSINPAMAGAGLGAGIGALTAGKGNRLKGAGKGALTGGAIGFGTGVANDAYHLGDNTRNELVGRYQSLSNEINQRLAHPGWRQKLFGDTLKPITDWSDQRAETLKGIPWYKYFYPPAVEGEMYRNDHSNVEY